MRVFISWSGGQSRELALALREWLRLVLQSVDPWLSDVDIDAGARWSSEVGKRLESSNFGILCLTSENLRAPWLHFEAGALAKSLSVGAVCPYLLDVDFVDISSGPLAQFQAKKADRKSTFDMISSINNKSTTPVDERILSKLFQELWPSFEQELSRIRSSSQEPQPRRNQADVLEDLFSSVRSIGQRIDAIEQQHGRLDKLASEFFPKADEGISKIGKEFNIFCKSQHLYNATLSRMLGEQALSTPAPGSRESVTLPEIKPSEYQGLSLSELDKDAAGAPPLVIELEEEEPSDVGLVEFIWSRKGILATLILAVMMLLAAAILSIVDQPNRRQQASGRAAIIPALGPAISQESTESRARLAEKTIRSFRGNRHFRRFLEAYNLPEEVLWDVIAKEVTLARRKTLYRLDTPDPAEYFFAQIREIYGFEEDGEGAAETEFLLLTLGFKYEQSRMKEALANRKHLDNYDMRRHRNAAMKICGRTNRTSAGALAESANEALVVLYGDEATLLACSVK